MTEIDLDYQANQYNGMVGKSRQMLEVFRNIDLIAPADVHVLVLGETGTGKEMTSKSIHAKSSRRNAPFVVVHTAAIPETLIESELYGHERGSYTGAHRERKGKFQEADKGTILLDEIGSMPLEQQSRFLRVLEDMLVTPVGSDKPVQVDVRVIAATNVDLYRAIRRETFRQDLYYRLSPVTIQLPPLRERIGDIPMLIKYFMDKYQTQYDRKVEPFSVAEYIEYMRYRWPGNVRELEGAVKSIILQDIGKINKLSELKEIANQMLQVHYADRRDITDIIERATGYPVAAPQASASTDGTRGVKEIGKQAAAAAEKAVIKQVLDECHWNRVDAARKLKISYKALLYKIQNYGL